MKSENTYLRIVSIISQHSEPTVEFIALKTNLTSSQAKEAIDKLKKLNIIENIKGSEDRFKISSNPEIPTMDAYYSLND